VALVSGRLHCFRRDVKRYLLAHCM